MIKGYDWTIDDTYAAQTLCPYEEVSISASMYGVYRKGKSLLNGDGRLHMVTADSANFSLTRNGSALAIPGIFLSLEAAASSHPQAYAVSLESDA